MKSIGREEATQKILMVKKKLKKIISDCQDAHKTCSGIECKEVDKDKKIVDEEFTMCLALGTTLAKPAIANSHGPARFRT